MSQLYRETQRYSYRPDGTVAAYELEKKRIDAASWKHHNAEEKQSSTTTHLNVYLEIASIIHRYEGDQ